MENTTIPLQHGSFKELNALGIKKTYNLGKNEFGFTERIIELNDGTQYDYIPEDNYYEIRTERYEVSVSW